MDIIMHEDLSVSVLLNTGSQAVANQVTVNNNMATPIGGGENGQIPMGDSIGTQVKDPILSSWPFVVGISVVSLAFSVAIGILLAKRKIKKGFELYED